MLAADSGNMIKEDDPDACVEQRPQGVLLTFTIALLLGGTLTATSPTSAHPGGLNAEGCHTNRKTGDYHCHRAPRAAIPATPVKKSQTGICHAPGTRYYEQTVRFTPYQTMEECLAGAWRLTKR
jgi:hypothetical protein